MNEHSPKFELVKGYYDTGEWKKKAIKNAVKRSWITADEYEEITGEPYAG
ncbi:MAG: XkdX family protein [Clostridia bacterium]|nr:XkdX family protein [Clostridia bacterium]